MNIALSTKNKYQVLNIKYSFTNTGPHVSCLEGAKGRVGRGPPPP